MKLIINTQYRENYSAGEDGTVQYWKNKGGVTYVVRDLTDGQVRRIKATGIPTLSSLIEYNNAASEEIIVDWNIVDDKKQECENWETQVVFSYENPMWTCRTHHTFSDDEYIKQPITCKSEKWTPTKGAGREDYSCSYKTPSGWLDSESKQLKWEIRNSAKILEAPV